MKYLSKKLLLSAALMASTALSAAADVNLTFRFNDSEREEMRAALDEFEAANPGITVDMQTIAWKDSRDQFLRESAVGQGPDVVHIAFVWTQEMAEAGAVTAIDDLVQYGAFPNGFEDHIATDLTKYEGTAYGVPWSADTWAMVYRTDVLEEAGVSDFPTTWDELLEDSKIVKEKTGKTGFAFPAANQIWFPVNYYLWSNGAEFVSADGNGGYKVGVTKEQLVDAMNYFKTYLDDGLVSQSILSIDMPHDPALMQALIDGQQGMAVMPTNTFRQLLSAWEEANPGAEVPLQSGVMMGGSEGPKTHLGGRTLVVNSNTKHPEEAWKLMQFLNSAPLFEKYYTNQFPAQKTMLSEIEYRPEESGFSTQLAENTRTWGAYADSGVGVGPLWNVTSRAFGAALSGQNSPEQAADELIAEINRMLGN
ncbi:multiple sugar transport system substrate-binding protein [Aliiroseovarius halocynthiae]|uniref:Sugar ABC transporter substrate-binding protein n=1 Tax=Aliiroseovarius halocynthiae TaxID=985055 RepID=A0A545SL43_9RHOB|nr:sugar ABC transporter substrate-binding protein [Aliiroseovarius halocynthiae]TQV65704.1 sugar ABC transporter substrate-binding protein [Aliiroseovarius halocynthiae]SMR83938.1 multiple sugar transport system substrate-binding protein [Aliiroseovarius halocynthiae]